MWPPFSSPPPLLPTPSPLKWPPPHHGTSMHVHHEIKWLKVWSQYRRPSPQLTAFQSSQTVHYDKAHCKIHKQHRHSYLWSAGSVKWHAWWNRKYLTMMQKKKKKTRSSCPQLVRAEETDQAVGHNLCRRNQESSTQHWDQQEKKVSHHRLLPLLEARIAILLLSMKNSPRSSSTYNFLLTYIM